MFRFHPVCGSNIKLSPDFRSAERTSPKTDFNNAIVFTDRTLETNVIFQLQIQKKFSVWNGGLEIGVTKLDPNLFMSVTAGSPSSRSQEKDAQPDSSDLECAPAPQVPTLPQIATELKHGTWLMSSHMILENGEVLLENYGYDLEKLNEGDTVGLMRTLQGNLIYFVNGTPQGIAVEYIPNDVYCIVNLYGKCSQVTIVDVQVADLCTNTVELTTSATSDILTAAEAAVVENESNSQNQSVCATDSSPHNTDNNISEHDKLRFHEKCGPLVKLTNHNRAAERIRPMEEFNNAVVLTHRSLKMNELFQIRLDLIIAKWSGSLEFGLTGHKPETFDLPATLTVVKNTVIMSGNGVLHNGRATSAPYTHFNLDQLQEGDRIGVMMKTNGEVHYFVNGSDQGVATTGLSPPVWGCINLYGMAAKVTIVDRNEHEEHNLRLSVRGHDFLTGSGPLSTADDILTFHPNCGFHAAVINGGKTAHRPNARDDFNHGVVLTNRTLKSNELFVVVLNKLVKKWAGSIEIGVTTHVPAQLEYPCTMTNVRTGTWILTGNGIMHNGVSIIDDYGQSLDKLKVGDTVGVMRKSNGNLHFYVNGEDQGRAATNVPPAVYGVIDLYGQAAEATIVANSMDNNVYLDAHFAHPPINSISSINTEAAFSAESAMKSGNNSDDMRFHTICGKNARVSNNGMTVSRPNALGEFNASIAVSSRELRDNELFEVIIQRMIDRWSGNLEVGVTTIPPQELDFPNTMTDVDHDVWMLTGSNIMIGGNTVTQRYNCNLDSLTVGSRVGIMRKSDNTLHFFVNGQDKGVAATDIPKAVWAVFDLYGQCQQISIIKPDSVSALSSQIGESSNYPMVNELGHRFSNCCGKNIVLKSNNLEATRIRHYTNALVFSSLPLELDELFEVRISEINPRWAGCLVFGITSLCVTDDSPASSIPYSISSICTDTWFVAGSQIRKNNVVIRDNYCFNLHRLCIGDRVGILISSEQCLHFYINGEDMGIAVYNLPGVPMYTVFDIFGKCESIAICSTAKNFISPTSELRFADHEEQISAEPSPAPVCSSVTVPPRESSSLWSFHTKCGKNIEFNEDYTIAIRNASYNEGIVLTNQILKPEQIFQVKITRLNPSWTSSLRIGVIESQLEHLNIPWTALQFKPKSCIVSEDCVFQNGYNVKMSFEPNLDTLQEGDVVGIFIDTNNCMHLTLNGMDYGVAAKEVGPSCRVVVDLYGKCEQVTIVVDETLTVSSLKHFVNNEKPADETALVPCDYLAACVSFKHTLCLPEPYFPETDPNVCYCDSCIKARGEELITQHGDPPSKYMIPWGWVRFPININFEYTTDNPMMTSSTSLNNVLTSWHVAYHGLRISHVREVLDVGQLFVCDEEFRDDLQGRSIQRSDDMDGDVLIFSPNPDYAGIPEFSPSHPYTEFSTKKKWQARVAFQILVKPGSYKTAPISFPNSLPKQEIEITGGSSDVAIDLESMEWSTKEERSTYVSALLVRLEEIPQEL